MALNVACNRFCGGVKGDKKTSLPRHGPGPQRQHLREIKHKYINKFHV